MELSGIRRARKKAGLTQNQLADILDISRATLSKYEGGQISPSIGQLSKIATALNTTVAEMLGNDFSGVDFSDAKESFSSIATDAKKDVVPHSFSQQLDDFIGEVKRDPDGTARKDLLEALARMKPEFWEQFAAFCDELYNVRERDK